MASIEIDTAGNSDGDRLSLRSPKRLKTDHAEEEEDEDDGWDTDSSSQDPEKYNINIKFRKLKYLDGLTDLQIQQLRTYYAEAYESHGFDITTEPPPGRGMMRPILRLHENIDPILEKIIMIRVNAAIDCYNKRYKDKGKNLAFHKLITANLHKDEGRFYYITFEARDTVKDSIKTYQTRVQSFQNYPEDPNPLMTVQVFRRQPKKRGA